MMRPHQMAAIAKIGVGGVRIASGMLAVYGKGLTAKICKLPGGGGQRAATLYGQASFRHGLEMVRDGLFQFCS